MSTKRRNLIGSIVDLGFLGYFVVSADLAVLGHRWVQLAVNVPFIGLMVHSTLKHWSWKPETTGDLDKTKSLRDKWKSNR